VRLTAAPFAIAALLAAYPAAAAEAAGLSKAVTWLPGTTVDFSSFAEVITGYDSNPDNLEIHTGSAFEKAEAGITAWANSGGDAYALSLLTRQYEFQNLAISHRWDFRIRGDADFDISATQRLKAGASYLRDFIPLNRADIFKGYLDYTRLCEKPDPTQ
jgi:hypothetical protein